jgi:hypothetical protein
LVRRSDRGGTVHGSAHRHAHPRVSALPSSWFTAVPLGGSSDQPLPARHTDEQRWPEVLFLEPTSTMRMSDPVAVIKIHGFRPTMMLSGDGGPEPYPFSVSTMRATTDLAR